MNSQSNIESLLNKLVDRHVEYIKNNIKSECLNKFCENDESDKITKCLNAKLDQIYIEEIIQTKVKHEIKELLEQRNNLFNSFNKLLLVEGSCHYLYGLVPNVYDFLMVLFQNTNSAERHQYFCSWVRYYYNNLIEKLDKNNHVGHHVLPNAIYEYMLRKILPYIRIDLVTKTMNKEQDILILEIIEFIKCPKILREDCYQVVNKILNNQPFKLLHYELVPILDSAGTLGEYYTLKLLVEHDDKKENFRFFSKYLPSNNRTNEDQKKLARDIFHKEVFFYSRFVPRVIELGFGDIVDFAPKFYFGRDNDVLVLEDVDVYGYKMSDIRQPGSFEWLLPIVKNLAKLHACSLLLEEKLSKETGRIYRIDEEYGKNLIETLVVKENILTENSMKTVIDYFIDKFPDIPKKFSIEEFKRKARKKLDMIYKMVQKSTKYRNVIVHGDLWASNILYKEVSSKSVSSYIIDFQLVKYCLPTYDLMVVIYTNTSKEVRDKYKDQLIQVYYKDLTDILKCYGVDINGIYDKKTFDICCKLMKSTGIGMGIHLVQTFVTPDRVSFLQTEEQDKKTEFLSGDRSKFLEQAIYDEPLRSRVRDLLIDLYQVCEEDEEEEED